MAYFFRIALTAYAAQCIEIKNVVKFSISTYPTRYTCFGRPSTARRPNSLIKSNVNKFNSNPKLTLTQTNLENQGLSLIKNYCLGQANYLAVNASIFW